MKPNIAVVGPSGFGKSSSLENLNPERTVILNVERKILPFRTAGLFKRQRMIANIEEFDKRYDQALINKDKNIDVLVIESFTALSEMILTKAKKTQVGYDVYGWYQTKITDYLQRSKTNEDFYVIFTAVDDVMQDEGGISQRDIKVEGQAMRGKIGKEFVICLFTHIERDDKGDPKYQFLTNSDGIRIAKSPKGMFAERYIPNDLNYVIQKAEEYYKIDEPKGGQ